MAGIKNAKMQRTIIQCLNLERNRTGPCVFARWIYVASLQKDKKGCHSAKIKKKKNDGANECSLKRTVINKTTNCQRPITR